jgi:hypothetical protein
MDQSQYNSILTAEDYAQQIFNRYAKVDEAAQQAGTSLDDAVKTLAEHRGGKADKALGKWIKANNVDFDVHKAEVELGSSFDQATSDYIKQIMVANKWNRAGLAKNVAAATYKDLVAAGWDKKAALQTAMDVGEKQTVYHMLDFANRLQVEQDLRWLSYFATKHRLYWKWVISTMARNPRYAAAVFGLQAHSRRLRQRRSARQRARRKGGDPRPRLVWVPGREYSEVSPLVQAGAAFLKSGGSLQAAFNSASGRTATSSPAPTRRLSCSRTSSRSRSARRQAPTPPRPPTSTQTTTRQFYREINTFQQDYFHQHGVYALRRSSW